MGVVVSLAMLLLAGVFALAAIAKLSDRAGSIKAVTDFGVAAAVARPLSLVLPMVELLVTVLLVMPRATLWGGIGALALLSGFTIGIVVNLARGRAPDCHCFGQLHSAPIGWQTLLRNALLAACAVLVVWQGRDETGFSALQTLSELGTFQRAGGLFAAVAVAAFVAQGWVILHLYRQHGRILLRLDGCETALRDSGLLVATNPHTQLGLAVGFDAPSFEISVVSGGTTTLEQLRGFGRPVLMIFSDPGCSPCNALMPDISRWEREYADTVTIAVISTGSVEAHRAKTFGYGLKHVLLQRDREVAAKYLVSATPSALLIRTNGTIGSSVAMGAEAIGRLVEHVRVRQVQVPPASGASDGQLSQSGSPSGKGGLNIGQRAPSFRLFDLEGHAVECLDFKGQKTVLIFWNPMCGFCSRMLSDLRALEYNRPTHSPRILVISTGTVDLNREMQLASTILLDPSFSVGTSYHVTGTPSALLVDSDGNVASPVVVGGPQVLALAAVEAMSQPA